MIAVSRRVALALAVATFAFAGAAQAATKSVSIPLTGAQQVPPVETSGSGKADLTYDPGTKVVTWTITFSGLSSPATMAHFHGPAPEGKNGPVVMWLSKQGTPPESPITGQATLTPAQAQQFEAGDWYINVHSQAHPAGELRGQIPKVGS